MNDKPKHGFGYLLRPMPAEAFNIKAPVTVPEFAKAYICYKYAGAPCTIALCMRCCASCVLIRR